MHHLNKKKSEKRRVLRSERFTKKLLCVQTFGCTLMPLLVLQLLIVIAAKRCTLIRTAMSSGDEVMDERVSVSTREKERKRERTMGSRKKREKKNR